MDANVEEEFCESVSEKFSKFCQENGISDLLATNAWEEYSRAQKDYVLQGDPFPWLFVSILVVSIRSSAPILDYSTLLNNSGVAVIDFLIRLLKWTHMFDVEPEIKELAEKLYANYLTTSRLFSLYLEKYNMVFHFPSEFSIVDTTYNKRKQRKRPVSNNEVMFFTWILFLSAKIKMPWLNNDPIKLLNLLASSIYLVFSASVLNANLNSKLLKNTSEQEQESDSSLKFPTNIQSFSKKIFQHETDHFHKTLKDFYNKNFKKLLSDESSKGNLRLNLDNLNEFLDPDPFSHNMRKLDLFYKEAISNSISFDERYFYNTLQEHSFCAFSSVQLKLVINSCKSPLPSHVSESSPVESPVKKRSLIYRLNKIYMPNYRFNVELSKLECFDLSPEICSPFVSKAFEIMNSQPNSESVVSNFEIVIGIYYSLLISIIKREIKRCSSTKLFEVFNNQTFNFSLIACAFEIFFYLFEESGFLFPFILNVFEIDSFRFFRIIEVIIRSDTNLSRDVVKYLNEIEENIVNHEAWKTGSSLFNTIEKIGSVPMLTQVHPSTNSEQDINLHPLLRPLTAGNSSSTTPVSAANLFLDPLKRKKLASVTRNLFSVSNESVDTPSTTQKEFRFRITKSADELSQGVIITRQPVARPLHKSQDASESSEHSTESTLSPTKRLHTPLNLFMRKLYRLACFRLSSVCEFLRMSPSLKNKCWSCIEHVIVHFYFLFENHYFDQLLICCVYAVGRSSNENWSFNEILRWYRSQDYCNLRVFRDVLLHPLPNECSSTVSISSERGDLITYYNRVFIPSNSDDILLTSLPRFKSLESFSPQKLSSSLPVYVSPKKTVNSLPITTLYRFPESPISEKHFASSDLSPTSVGSKRKSILNESLKPSNLLCDSPLKIQKTQITPYQ